MYIRGRVCVKGCATMRPATFLYIFSCTIRLFLLPLQYKRKQQPKHINPTNPNIMIIKHLHGGVTNFCFLRQCNVWRVSPFLQSFSQ